MGNNSSTNYTMASFPNNLRYYMSSIDIITKKQVHLYNYEELIIQKIILGFSTHQQVEQYHQFLMHFRDDRQSSIVLDTLQKIYKITTERNIQICSNTNYNMQIIQDHFNYTLQEHLESLRHNNKVNSEENLGLSKSQLLYILKQMSQIGTFFDKKKLSWERLDSQSLFIDPVYAIRVPIAYLKYLRNRQDHQKFQNKFSMSGVPLLSPQQLNTNEKYHQSLSASIYSGLNISRVFSLGMIILECYSLLDSGVTYYTSNNSSSKLHSEYTINIDKLNQSIKAIKYQQISSLLSRMLQIDPKKRISFSKMLRVLNKIDFDQFQIGLIVN